MFVPRVDGAESCVLAKMPNADMMYPYAHVRHDRTARCAGKCDCFTSSRWPTWRRPGQWAFSSQRRSSLMARPPGRTCWRECCRSICCLSLGWHSAALGAGLAVAEGAPASPARATVRLSVRACVCLSVVLLLPLTARCRGRYYDLFLQRCRERAAERGWPPPVTVALAYRAQLVDEVPPCSISYGAATTCSTNPSPGRTPQKKLAIIF